MNADGTAFGEHRLELLLEGLRGNGASDLGCVVIEGVQLFVGGAAQSDDIAALAARFASAE